MCVGKMLNTDISHFVLTLQSLCKVTHVRTVLSKRATMLPASRCGRVRETTLWQWHLQEHGGLLQLSLLPRLPELTQQ